MSKIFVWIKEPFKTPRHVYISSSSENLSKYFKHMEKCSVGSDACILCERDSEFTDLKYNATLFGRMFFGDIILSGKDPEGNLVDWPLNNADTKRMFSMLWEERL